MTKAIVINYIVFVGGEEIATGDTTIFGKDTYNKLMIKALTGLRNRYVGCNVYANSINILK